MHNFDKVLDRRQTNSLKWDSIASTYQEEDLLPLWVADMDFMAAEPVIEKLVSTAKQGILGYTWENAPVLEAIRKWQETHYDYKVAKEAILFSSGVVPSIILAIQALTLEGEAVLIHNPVYPPFADSIRRNNRRLVQSSLKIIEGKFKMDLADMEAKILKEDVKLFILCNPHNPGGRVWSQQELREIGDLCKKHSVLVVSDEIHQDLIFSPYQFTTFCKSGIDFEEFTITLTSATKTFNLAGIKNSMLFITNPNLRHKLEHQLKKNGQGEISTFGLAGTQAAYEFGGAWHQELLGYLKKNLNHTLDFFSQNLPQVNVMEPEGTYLIWLDFSAFGLDDKELEERFIHKGKVVLNSGISFGSEGSQFMRLNLACPFTTLNEGLERIHYAFTDLL